MKTIFRKSRKGRRCVRLPADHEFREEWIPVNMRGTPPALPEVDELTLVRHYTALSRMNHAVDAHFYPLGSCTMKYNPKLNEYAAALPSFRAVHPLVGEEYAQGILRLMYELGEMLAEIAGLAAVTLQPAAGAHGELTGLMMASAYFEKRGERGTRTEILIPDSAHGTNPASAALCGYTVREVRSGTDGLVDVEDFKEKLSPATALMMITNPNTLGLFEKRIAELARMLHDNGSLLYMDGANLNAIMGVTRPGDFGVDIMHFNLHKTFSTPHGGGGPGSGPVGVKEDLVPFLPVPVVTRADGRYELDWDRPDSIGKVHAFYGNVSVMVKAYAYLKSLGRDGVRRVAEYAVLNANYLKACLREEFEVPYGKDTPCMHEFVISAEPFKREHGFTALDIAKALIERDIHPPTVYFPLIVPEALMIEPTETESPEALDRFARAMREIASLGKEDPGKLHAAPATTPVSRPDEVRAARNPVLTEDDLPEEGPGEGESGDA